MLLVSVYVTVLWILYKKKSSQTSLFLEDLGEARAAIVIHSFIH